MSVSISIEPQKVYKLDNRRIYEFERGKFTSVTSILSLIKDDTWLRRAKGAHNKRNPVVKWDQYVDEAALCGTYLHYRLACDLADDCGLPYPEFEPEAPLPETDYVSPDGMTYNRRENHLLTLAYWNDFKRMARPHVIGTGLERFLYHSSGYAGRVDAILGFDVKHFTDSLPGEVDRHIFIKGELRQGDIWVVDFKSSKGIYNEYPAQLYAYWQAWNEICPESRANRMAVLRMNGEKGWEFTEVTANDTVKVGKQSTTASLAWDIAMERARDKGWVKA